MHYRRICDSNEVFEESLKELRGYFIKRGFKENAINSQFSKARGRIREKVLGRGMNNKGELERIPLVVNFHPALSGIGKIVDSLWPILHVLGDMREIFKEKPVVSYKRPKSLKGSLVRSKLRSKLIRLE